MTDKNDTKLERRYLRLLRWYPRAFRRNREQEMLAVLMAGSREGQQWPRMVEVFDLICRAIPARLGVAVDWERQYGWVIPIRVLVCLWLVALTTVFCLRGEWWGLALLTVIPLHGYFIKRNLAFRRNAATPGGGMR
jgi:hypothetical protein